MPGVLREGSGLELRTFPRAAASKSVRFYHRTTVRPLGRKRFHSAETKTVASGPAAGPGIGCGPRKGPGRLALLFCAFLPRLPAVLTCSDHPTETSAISGCAGSGVALGLEGGKLFCLAWTIPSVSCKEDAPACRAVVENGPLRRGSPTALKATVRETATAASVPGFGPRVCVWGTRTSPSSAEAPCPDSCPTCIELGLSKDAQRPLGCFSSLCLCPSCQHFRSSLKVCTEQTCRDGEGEVSCSWNSFQVAKWCLKMDEAVAWAQLSAALVLALMHVVLAHSDRRAP